MIGSFKSRSLKSFWSRNDASKVRADWRLKVGLVLDRLDAATAPEQLDLPGFNFHPLTGDRAGTFSVLVSRFGASPSAGTARTRSTSTWRIIMVAKRRGRRSGPSTTAWGSATKLDDVVETLPDLTERPAKPPRRPKRHPDLAPSHPGALLREIVLPGTGRPKVEIAKLLGVSRQTLYDVLSEKAAVTPQLAVRLGKMFGDGPEPWLRMQAAHDVWTVSRTLADEIAAIPTLAAAAE